MKMFKSAVVLFLAAAVSGEVSAFILAERGKPADCEIVLPSDATPANRTAAKELADGVKRITGIALPICETGRTPPPDSSAASRRIVLRRDSSAAESEFRLKVAGRVLLVSGGDRGICYGVFEILERFGGVEWFAEGVETFPPADTLEIPDGFSDEQKPAIPVRDSSWRGALTSASMAAHLRLNGPHVQKCGMQPYGDIAVKWAPRLGHCHTFKHLIPVAEYGKEHPEYFAIQKDGTRNLGDRHGPNPCLTNPDVKRIVVERVVRGVREYPGVNYFGVSQNDTRLWCRCPTCEAVNRREGTDAGTLIELVNEVARAVAKVRSNAIVTTLAYHMTREPPKTLKLEPNVMITLCTTECDFSAPLLGNPNGDTQRFVAALTKWCSLTKYIYIYDYMMNYRLAGHAMPNVAAFNENVKLYRDNGVGILYASGGSTAAWFAELKNYIEAKSMWNPDRDMEPFVRRFMSAWYGPAAAQARAVLDLFEKYPRDREKYPMPYYDDILSPGFPDELFEKAAALWKEAAAVAPEAPFAARVANEALKNDFTRVSRFVSRKGTARKSDGTYLQEMRAAAERLVAYEERNPSHSIGWFWYKHVQTKVYKFLGRKPPERNAKKFGEL